MKRPDLNAIEQEITTLREEWLEAWGTDDQEQFNKIIDRLNDGIVRSEIQGTAAVQGVILEFYNEDDDAEEIKSKICLEVVAKLVGLRQLKLWLSEGAF